MGIKLRNQATVLILAEVILIVTSAFWGESVSGAPLLTVFYFGFFSLGGYTIARDKRWLRQYIILCLICLSCSLISRNYFIDLLGMLSASLAYVLIFKLLIWHSFIRQNIPKTDRILSGVAGYILLGLFWANAFMFLGNQYPGSILNQVSGVATTRSEELYYSFVTITSLGYGDIVPVSSVAKVVAVFAGLSGTLYTAIFISALISGLKRHEAAHSAE